MRTLDLKLNPNARIKVQPVGEHEHCVVVDDFLQDPDAVVEYAAARAHEFEVPANSYPGLVLDLRRSQTDGIYDFIRRQMSRKFPFMRGGVRMTTMLSMTTLRPAQLSNLQRLCHTDPRTRVDRANYAGLLYLFEDEQLGGTGFYRWKQKPLIEQATALEMNNPDEALTFLQQHFETYNHPPAYMSDSNEIAELIELLPARFNRWIFYSGDLPHSAYIRHAGKLTNDFHKGRLTLNTFATVMPKP